MLNIFIYEILLYLLKLPLQVKIQLSLILLFFGFLSIAQNTADYNLHEKNGKVYLAATITLEEVQNIISDEEYCASGVSTSFCLRNYLSEKLDVSVNGGDKIDFIIDASLENAIFHQINLSSEQSGPVTSFTITNNAFVDEIEGYKIKVSGTLGNNTTKTVLDANNRIVTIQ